MINEVKRKLLRNEVVIGSFVTTNSADAAEILAIAGFDFVVIDTEHGSMSIETITNHIRAVESKKSVPIVRVTENNETTILRSLDVGAYGIHIPQINTREDAEKMVNSARYYPLGKRGVATARALWYGMGDLHQGMEQCNEETLVIPHIENIKGVENLGEIVKVKGIDVIFIGPFDLSQSLGVPGQIHHPKVEAAFTKALAIANEAKVPAGTFVTNVQDAALRIEQGFKYIAYGMDASFLAQAAQNGLGEIRKLIK